MALLKGLKKNKNNESIIGKWQSAQRWLHSHSS